MKKLLSLCVMLFLALNLSAQTNYQHVWSLNQLPFQVANAPSEMAMVKAGFDTDNDGKGEFICSYTDLDTNHVMMYEATGDNTYELVWSWALPVPVNSFASFAVGDLDGNGLPEIIVTAASRTSPNPNPPRLWVFEWTGVQGENKYGSYANVPMQPSAEWNFNVEDNLDFRPYSLIVDDIDNDGQNELVVGVRQGGRGREVLVVSVVGNFDGFASFDIEYNLQGLTGGSLYCVATGDIDNDGKKEIVALIWNYFSIHIIKANGPNNYELVKSLDTLYKHTGVDYGSVDGIVINDIDGDGKNEMYIAGTEPTNTIFVVSNLTNAANLTAEDVKVFMTIPVNAGGKFRSMQVMDMNGNGRKSLMIAGESNGQLYDVQYKGSGDPALAVNWDVEVAFDLFQHSGFSPTDNPTISPRFFYASPAKDMDGDGKNEFISVNYSSDFAVWPGDGYLFMVEHQTVSSIDGEVNANPSSFVLGQNYPNPFNPITKIEYYIPENGLVTLNVYDILGNLVAELANGTQVKGSHSVNFNASSLASGTYLYRLNYNGKSVSKKLLLLK
ncbi:MAG TPA: FG-GAP-like repeat-containing protein [Ignavibacteriaceae bacterium]|nr:FG-GAP-like repeat-containing protein [Ignavibacteriaceae bacterium]